MDCGPTCLKMICQYYGKYVDLEQLRNLSEYNKEGVSLLSVADTAKSIGFETEGVKLIIDQLIGDAKLPCILFWDQNHFVVLVKISCTHGGKTNFTIADPSKGLIHYTKNEFRDHWCGSETANDKTGTVLFLTPTDTFYKHNDKKKTNPYFSRIKKHLVTYRWKIASVFALLLLASFIQILIPLLTRNIVDKGIGNKKIQLIVVMLVAQFMLTVSRTVIDFIRSKLLLKISVWINICILSDFWTKFMKLPMAYFGKHHIGDTMQRIEDSKLLERFLTGIAINTVFYSFSLLLFSSILVSYNITIFLVFISGSILYLVWICLFLNPKKKLNYQTFRLFSQENSTILQMVQGIQEIKLYNAEKIKYDEWKDIQSSLNNIKFKNLSYSQLQQAGALLITECKNFTITFLVSLMVIKGELTLGTMLAIQYIIGQLGTPIETFVNFIQIGQEANISFKRLNDIHGLPDEEENISGFRNDFPEDRSIQINNLSFSYHPSQEPVLNGITLTIPENKTSAIVGVSGSGKTTFLKLLMKHYDSYEGNIKIGGADLSTFSPTFWRSKFGVVLQDSFIFNDTIAKNISLGDDQPDKKRLIHSCKTANILSFIESLPNGFQSKMGTDGIGISSGQKQRLVLARAIYKNPDFLFLDEATNAVDANTEKLIVNNLISFSPEKTVVIIAHRLNTIKHADNIVVFDSGTVVEQGTHEALLLLKGYYYKLVENQLGLQESKMYYSSLE